MPQATVALVLLIGLAIGALSGIVGLGGGIMVIPVLMFGFGFSQAKASGTSLAMLLPPIGCFAVLSYWKAGNIDWRFAFLLAIGFTFGAYLGAALLNRGLINPSVVRTLLALLLLYVTSRLLFYPGGSARAAIETSVLLAAFVVPYSVAKLVGRRWERSTPDALQIYNQRRQYSAEQDYTI